VTLRRGRRWATPATARSNSTSQHRTPANFAVDSLRALAARGQPPLLANGTSMNRVEDQRLAMLAAEGALAGGLRR
jgi:hypothetical protein